MKPELHILFISSWYPSRILPYNGDFIQRHAEALALIHNVTAIHVIADSNLKTPLEIIENNQNGVKSLIAYVKSSRNIFVKFYRFFGAYLMLIKKAGAFNLVHLNVIFPAGFIALYLKWFKQKPYLISEHWHGYHQPFCKEIGFFKRFFMKLIAKNASVICPVTDNLGFAMADFGIKNDFIKVPNVIDTDLFKPAEREDKIFNIIHISSMEPVKNVPKILEIISQLQKTKIDFKFFLIGNNAQDFNELAHKLDINDKHICFVNQLPQQALIPYLQQADVLVLFSSIENSPCVILEAFACGVPVISTDVGGISEHFPKVFGTLIKTNDSQGLLNKLQQYQQKKETTSKEVMHQYVNQNFSKKAIAKQFTKVYLRALKK